MSLSNITITPVQNALERIWLGVGAILATVVVMWIFNIIGLQGVNVPIALIGTLLIVMVGFKATLLVNFGIFGAFISLLQDKDKSQGVATGFIWLTNLVVALGLGFVLAAFTLMTWSFKQAPGAFWILFFGVTLILLVQQHFKLKSNWAPKIVTGYALICILVAGFTTFGGAYTGNSFNPETGEPRYMVDPVTRNVIDGIEPRDCRPVIKKDGESYKYTHLNKNGMVFDYATKGTCFSPETGQRAVPMSQEEAIKRNPGAWVGGASQAVDATSLPGWFKESWGWLLAATAVIILLLSWRRARKATGTGSSASGQRSLSEMITAFNDNLLMWVVVLIFVIPILAITAIVLDIAGVPKTIMDFGRNSTHVAACATQDDFKINIDTAGKDIVLCPENGALFVFAEGNMPLVFDFSPKFRQENEHLLQERKLSDFVQIYPPGTYPGSIVGSWKVVPLQSLPHLKYVSAWDKSGMPDITLTVKAIR